MKNLIDAAATVVMMQHAWHKPIVVPSPFYIFVHQIYNTKEEYERFRDAILAIAAEQKGKH